jgi:hypothetical protein
MCGRRCEDLETDRGRPGCERQREEQLAAGADWDRASDPVFRDELGRSIHPD